jgi:hypothetical protein
MPVRMAITKKQNKTKAQEGHGEQMQRKGNSYTITGNVNYHNYYGEQYGGS